MCFTDARQVIARDGLRRLVSNFGDPMVGCVSGALMLSPSAGIGLYWNLEKKIRNWEGLSGSTVGATGAFYAVRRTGLSPIPTDITLDDVFIPLQIARGGLRVVFDSEAIAFDDLTPNPKQEFRRKVRTLTGLYQLLMLAPWTLGQSNPIRTRFVCHKLLRLLIPFALFGTLISALCVHKNIYEMALVLQTVLYTLGLLKILGLRLGPASRVSNIALAFIVLNTAAAMAFINFVTGRKAVWVR